MEETPPKQESPAVAMNATSVASENSVAKKAPKKANSVPFGDFTGYKTFADKMDAEMPTPLEIAGQEAGRGLLRVRFGATWATRRCRRDWWSF